MKNYLNIIRPEKFAILNDKENAIIIFKNFNLKNKIIFLNKKFKFINNSESESFLISFKNLFIEFSCYNNWYRIISKLGKPQKKFQTSIKIKIIDIKVDISSNQILILDDKSNLFFFNFFKDKLFFKKKIKLPIKFIFAKFDLIDENRILICLDNKKIIILENFKKICLKKKLTNTRIITSLVIFQNRIILVDQRNYCLQIYNLKGKFLRRIGSKGDGIRNFDLPTEIKIYKNDLVLSDQNNDRFITINKNFKNKLLKKRYKKKNDLNRPIKSLIIGKFLYVLDRENCRIQIFNLKLNFLKTFQLKKTINLKPNSFCHSIKNNCFFILYRGSNYKNFLIKYNNNLKVTRKKKINTLDAQDICCSNNYLFIANTLGRSIDKYDLNLNFIKKLQIDTLSNNSKVLIKNICIDQNDNIFIGTFDDFKIFKFDVNLKLINSFSLNKYAEELKVLRSIIIDREDNNIMYLLNRGKYPIWLYSIKKNKILEKVNIFKNNLFLRNPTSISMLHKNLFICDKENDRIVKKNLHHLNEKKYYKL